MRLIKIIRNSPDTTVLKPTVPAAYFIFCSTFAGFVFILNYKPLPGALMLPMLAYRVYHSDSG